MLSRIQRRDTCFLGVLALGCALIGGRPALAGPAQEKGQEPSKQKPPAAAQLSASEQQKRADWLRERDREERRRTTEAAKSKEGKAPATETQQHVPEIDASSIPTTLALVGASVLMLRARLQSK